jgi:hypothetical protein
MLHHKPGQSMGEPNALSRWADHGSGQGDNDNLTLIAPELFWIHALAGARFQGDEWNILQKVRRSLKDGAEARLRAQSGLRVRGYSCSAARSMSPMIETFGVISLNSTTIHALPDMQATLRPSS